MRAPDWQHQAVPPLLELIDLRLSARDLARHLVGQLLAAEREPSGTRHAERILDSFLLAAGLNQVWEDHLGADPFQSGKVAKTLADMSRGRTAAALADAGGSLAFRVRRQRPNRRRLVRTQRQLARLVEELAGCVMADEGRGAALDLEKLRAQAADLEDLAGSLGTGARLRPPSCFRSFDQRPGDMGELVDRFLSSGRYDGGPLVVLGARTSGSYLAPLVGAALRRRRCSTVRVITARPEQRGALLPRDATGQTRDVEATVLIVDDPPRTGTAVLQLLRRLYSEGVAEGSAVLMLALFPEGLPTNLEGYPSCLLPWADWEVHRLAETGSAPAAPSRRGHLIFRLPPGAAPPNGPDGEWCVEGTGLGYLGRGASVLAGRLGEVVPAVRPIAVGAVLRSWLADESRVRADEADTPETYEGLARYVARRRHALKVETDPSVELQGQGAAWQEASTLLTRLAFGRWAPLLRQPALAAGRRVLRAAEPVVVDGRMEPDLWFRGEHPGHLIKVGFSDGSFSNRDLASYDSLFDLAQAATWAGGPDGAGEGLRHAYESQTGAVVDEESWLLYRLLHRDRARHELSEFAALGAVTDAEAASKALEHETAMAACIQLYLGRRLLAGVSIDHGGPLCAFDVDGVLESTSEGVTSSSPRGIMALRALACHGYRSVLVSGRSVPEMKVRRQAYRLAGAVAEYGAAVLSPTGETEILLDESARESMVALRHCLSQVPGTMVHPGHLLSPRVSQVLARGRRRPVDDAALVSSIRRCGLEGRVRLVRGLAHTDVVHNSVDKGLALDHLAGVLGGDGPKPVVALAMGDTITDIPMLERAKVALAPANAERELRERVHALRTPTQDAVASGVARLVGHHPGGCHICRADQVGRRAGVVLTALDARAGGRVRKLRQAVAWGALANTYREA